MRWLSILLMTMFTSFNVLTTPTIRSIEHTTVEEDFSKDTSFKLSDYKEPTRPERDDAGSMSLLQIGLSKNYDLFVYIDQPSVGYNGTAFKAESINLYLEDNVYNVRNYPLEYVDNYYTLFKYKVKNIRLPIKTINKVNIVSLQRPYDFALGDKVVSGHEKTKAYAVDGRFIVQNVNDSFSYYRTKLETITVTDKSVGYLTYGKGVHMFYQNECNGHYIAFNTDKPIQKLYDADVSYNLTQYGQNPLGEPFVLKEEKNQRKTLSSEEQAFVTPDGLFGKNYSWRRISKVSEFIAHEQEQGIKFKEGVVEDLQKYSWVLRFLETDYHFVSTTGYHEYYDVTDQTILRLKFETNGKLYNLGVVDNKVDQPDTPSNEVDHTPGLTDFWDYVKVMFGNMWKIIQVILLVLLIVVLRTPISWVIKGIVWVVKHLWLLIKKAFNFIKNLFSRDKNKKKE